MNQLQGTLVPKLTLGPFITLNGHKLKDWIFGIPVHNKNNNQNFIKQDEDNNSQEGLDVITSDISIKKTERRS